MSPIKKMIGLGLASTLDVGTGVIITYTVWTVLGLEVGWPQYMFGIIFSMAPDLDLLVPFCKEFAGVKDSDSSHKANVTHYPLVTVPVCFLLVSVFSVKYAVLVVVCLVMHYIHDSWQSQENGPGIRWFYPFLGGYYQILSKNKKEEKIKIFCKVPPERVKETFQKNLEQWLENKFFQFTWENFIGVLVFVIAVWIVAVTISQVCAIDR